MGATSVAHLDPTSGLKASTALQLHWQPAVTRGRCLPKQFSRIVLDQLDTNIRLNIRAQFLQSKKDRDKS